uniref:DUF2892 domain-containing protein n=1 Tax=Panagrellus redivivus TaxID=6233 RepID=A0A7E4UX84_PANRE
MQPVHNINNVNGAFAGIQRLQAMNQPSNDSILDTLSPGVDRDVAALDIIKYCKMLKNEADRVKLMNAPENMANDSGKDEVESVSATSSDNTEKPMETDDAKSEYAFDGMNTAANDTASTAVSPFQPRCIEAMRNLLKPDSILSSHFPGINTDAIELSIRESLKMFEDEADRAKPVHTSEGTANDSGEKDQLAGDHKHDSTGEDECLETDEVKSEYAFDDMTNDSDDKDEVESVYAMDSETDPAETEKPMETDDVESVYAFEAMNTPSNDTVSGAVIADMTDKVKNAEIATLTYLGLALIFLGLAITMFLCKFNMTAFAFFIYMLIAFGSSRSYYLDYQDLKEQFDIIQAQLNDQNKIDIFQADDATDEVSSVYAFDGLNDNEAGSPEAVENASDIESVYAFDYEKDDVESVYAFEGTEMEHDANYMHVL